MTFSPDRRRLLGGALTGAAGLALAVMGVLLALGRTTGSMLTGRAPMLAMLSVLTPDEVSTALRAGDLATLMKIPGVGRKSAERLVLELKDKVGMPSGSSGADVTPSAASVGDAKRDQVAEALVGLGWSAKQASDAVTSVSASADPQASVAALLRMALRELGR